MCGGSSPKPEMLVSWTHVDVAVAVDVAKLLTWVMGDWVAVAVDVAKLLLLETWVMGDWLAVAADVDMAAWQLQGGGKDQSARRPLLQYVFVAIIRPRV